MGRGGGIVSAFLIWLVSIVISLLIAKIPYKICRLMS